MTRDISTEYRYRHGACQVSIGRFTYGVEHMDIRFAADGADLTIGSFCSIAVPFTVFVGGNHRADWITTFPFGFIAPEQLGATKYPDVRTSKGDVVIGNDVWTGANVTIMSGVTIGDGAIIAANSHVTRDVGAYEVFGGNPARKIRDRFSDDIRELLLALRWWELPVEDIRQIAPTLSAPPTKPALEALLARYRSA